MKAGGVNQESESERIRGEIGAIGKRGMLVEVDSVRRVFAEEGGTAFVEHYHEERTLQGKEMFCFR